MKKLLISGRQRRLYVAMCVLGLFTLPVVAQAQPPATTCGDATISNAIVQNLATLFRTQRSTGELVFTTSTEFYARYPLMATFVVEALEDHPDPAFVSRSTSAISRHYSFLFSGDENNNLLLERTIKTGRGEMIRVEDVAFNSLLALDLLNLSKLYLMRRQPLTALYWYEGARSIETRIVDAAFDPVSYDFYNTSATNQLRVPTSDALAVLPLMFSRAIGDNTAAEIATRHAVSRGNAAADVNAPTVDTALRALTIAEALHARGFDNDSRRIKATARDAIHMSGAMNGAPAYERVLACGLETESSSGMFDAHVALRLFGAIVLAQKQLEDNELVRTNASISDVIAFLSNPDTLSAQQLLAHEVSVRNLFQSISRTRDQMNAGTLFSPRDAVELSAVNGDVAMTRVLDDAAEVLKSAENRIFTERFRSNGLYASVTIDKDRLIAGAPVDMTWRVGTIKSPVTIVSAVAYTNQIADTLIRASAPAVVAAGGSIALATTFNPSFKRVGGLDNIATAILIEDSDGRRAQFNSTGSIYVDEPVTVLATFPRGRALKGSVLPIELTIVKRLHKPVTFEYNWYSPSGLRPREGTTARMVVPEEADTIVTSLGVVIPEQCRPGTFPVRLKFRANGRDVGVINSSLFKPYQWIFVGPMAVGDRPMAKRYAPEMKVDLLADYNGVEGRTSWRLLTDAAITANGAISLKDEMTETGVGYLYTVISSDAPAETPATLSTTVPSALFINGRRVLEGTRTTSGEPAYARIKLSQGLNEVLIKIHGNESSQIFFTLGGDGSSVAAEFGNNLWELVDGFAEIYDRSKLLRAGDGSETQRIVVLRYNDPQANSVSVVGSFNGWSPDLSRMQKSARGGWEITLSLAPGKYSYRFLINSRRQILDPECPISEPDGYGGSNSIITVE